MISIEQFNNNYWNLFIRFTDFMKGECILILEQNNHFGSGHFDGKGKIQILRIKATYLKS